MNVICKIIILFCLVGFNYCNVFKNGINKYVYNIFLNFGVGILENYMEF